MKICLIVDDYLPHSTKIAAKMMHELACEFKNQGHEITVITPYYDLVNNIEINYLDDIRICYFKSGKIKNVNKVTRALNETLLSYHAWHKLKKYLTDNPHDYIIYYSPTIFWGPLVKKLKRLWNVKSYLILRDIFPQWAIDHGLIKKNSLVEKYFRYFEKFNYYNADTIGLMSPKNLDWFKKNFQVDAKLEVLYNWGNNEAVKPTGKYRHNLNLNNKIIFFYGGNMGHAQDMMNIVKLAKKLHNIKKVHFLLVGSGDEVDLIKHKIKQFNLQNITLLPPMPQKEFRYLMAECDVGLFSLNKNHKTHNFPGKILGYMAQGLPILGSVNKGNDIIEVLHEKAGLISINDNDEIFYKNSLKLLSKENRIHYSQNAKKIMETIFSTKAACAQILKHTQ